MKNVSNQETFESLWEYCTSNTRVCPIPNRWIELYNMLNGTKQSSTGGFEPPLPLILGAWWEVFDGEKRDRLKIHIEWAKDHEQLDEIDFFLRSLPENEWSQNGESGPMLLS